MLSNGGGGVGPNHLHANELRWWSFAFIGHDTHPLTIPPIPQQGSALVVWWQKEPGADTYELYVFFQTENGEIIQDADANEPWVNSTVPAR